MFHAINLLVGCVGIEPTTNGLTCRTGFRRPYVAVWTISSPSAYSVGCLAYSL